MTGRAQPTNSLESSPKAAKASCAKPSGTSADAAMSLADGLLYAAKNGGRDRAEVENLITGERVTVQPPPVSERPS